MSSPYRVQAATPPPATMWERLLATDPGGTLTVSRERLTELLADPRFIRMHEWLPDGETRGGTPVVRYRYLGRTVEVARW